jgi:phenylalanine-4-hydroxylase
MRTKYVIDDFQQTYFVISSFEHLLEACYRDFGPLYEQLGGASDIEAYEVVVGDQVHTKGTLAYFKNRSQ